MTLEGKTIIVTGSPGFIGANLVQRLLKFMNNGHIISLDNMNNYYDPGLKRYRLLQIANASKDSGICHTFIEGDISDAAFINKVFAEYKPQIVVHLAAQAGVRYSIENPKSYIESNITGFFNILEACRHTCGLEHLVFASSSSVYGNNTNIPHSTNDKCDSPVSLYAATKKSGELLAYSYSKLYGMPVTGLRFFTVYGPAGRPDMFYFSAVKALEAGKPITVFNHGECKRDFTYIDDVVEGIVRVMHGAPSGDPPFAVYNIGKGKPDDLKDFIRILENEMIRQKILPEDFDFAAHTVYKGMQPGDMEVTFADTKPLETDYGYKPMTDIRQGLKFFMQWYKEYYTGKL